MTWANDETGLLVIAGTGKPTKPAKKAKTPKPEKAAKHKEPKAAASSSRPSMPGLPPVREPMPAQAATPARPMLESRPSVPVGVPIVRAPMRGMTTGASTGVHGRRSTRAAHGHPVLRAIGVMFVVVVIAAGGFAAGALTELGTEAENYVLGPTLPPAPVADPRVAGLEAEIARLQTELAEERQISIDTKAAEPAAPATSDAAAAVDEPDRESKKKKKKKKSRRDRDKRRIDL